MKKKYMKPGTEVLMMTAHISILAGSPRNFDNPVDDDDPIDADDMLSRRRHSEWDDEEEE